MKLPKNCDQCLNQYLIRSDKINTSRFCSKPCQMKNMGLANVKKLREKWSQQDEIEEMNKSFNKFAVKKDGCWSWSGSKKARLKYGNLSFRGKSLTAHRASYMIHKGPIPHGLLVLHKCDNPECTNPDHLWVGTYLENQRDKMAKGRGKVEKLTIDQVKEIKKLISMGVVGTRICKDFNISRTTLHSINIGTTWKDIV